MVATRRTNDAAPTCAECGRERTVGRFDGRQFEIEHGGQSSIVEGLAGWECPACGEVQFDAESARRYAAAGDALVLAQRKRISQDIRRIRRKLGLSQADAARLTGGGHNAFSRYERGEASPMPAVVNLFRLLDQHPELLRELQAPAAATQD